MAENKMKETDSSVLEFIENIENPSKRTDSNRLLEIFTKATGYEAKLWGTSIIGFGKYHYKYASGHEGEAPLVGFSPQKAKISLYLTLGSTEREELLKDLGKHTAGKACVYINKVSDINTDVLSALIINAMNFLRETYK